MKIITKLILRSILILIFIISILSSLSAENIWYVSPGICIGWNSSGNFVLDGKISIGINVENNSNSFLFYNLTLGFNALPFTKAKRTQSIEYNYAQFQAGTNLFENKIILSGMGAGFIFNTNSKNDFSPIVRFFSGLLIFPELDLLFLKSTQFRSNFGIRGIYPIPIPPQKIDIGLN